MKCLVVADLHYALKQWDWVHHVAEQFDLVIIAGDLLDLGSLVDRESQSIVVLKYLDRIVRKKPLLVCSGNHDGTDHNSENETIATWLLEAREAGTLVDGDFWEKDECLFTICPWWDGHVTRKEVGELIARDAARPKKRWIWIYHSPPDQTKVSWTGKTFAGDPYLVEWIQQYKPDMVLSGHIHQSPFRNEGSWIDKVNGTWVFNTGRQIGPEPAFILLDLENNQATWTSQAGQETMAL